ncbi:hypothetical protein R6U76_16475 [Lysinibacillus capsici]|uniref:hypothetical protein n=1 Tax=Lysinibacillus capsici TaxID=2115968 RepID=UPI0029DE6168|nr:hypothetical protein [Lysinibacillus capsici]WPK04264.1 hypothetical protein R6U76_16475 [Lysinibacillus capsici]
MSADLWRLDNASFALYVDSSHEREIRNIKRSRDWSVIATYQKNGRVVGLQWRVPETDYRAAKRIENRINKAVHEIEEKPSLDTG